MGVIFSFVFIICLCCRLDVHIVLSRFFLCLTACSFLAISPAFIFVFSFQCLIFYCFVCCCLFYRVQSLFVVCWCARVFISHHPRTLCNIDSDFHLQKLHKCDGICPLFLAPLCLPILFFFSSGYIAAVWSQQQTAVLFPAPSSSSHDNAHKASTQTHKLTRPHELSYTNTPKHMDKGS